MFCTEMDGIESLAEVVIILAASAQEEAISLEGLRASLDGEYLENDNFPPDDLTEEWLQFIDHDPENVVKVTPVRASSRAAVPSAVV